MGTGDWGLGDKVDKVDFIPMPNAQCPMPHSPCPMPHAPFPIVMTSAHLAE
ncbi:histidine kinase [Nostoc sp. CMAA1605]|uniref:histidine kinase n=1 Tax=Nostoc sp. CMAA1605 TaxID=2055159 RepID=UPI001F216685|nr:histidine kinase [Nostoc sp. CMAA1605]